MDRGNFDHSYNNRGFGSPGMANNCNSNRNLRGPGMGSNCNGIDDPSFYGSRSGYSIGPSEHESLPSSLHEIRFASVRRNPPEDNRNTFRASTGMDVAEQQKKRNYGSVYEDRDD